MIRQAIRPIIRNAIRPAINSGVGGTSKLRNWGIVGAALSTAYTSPSMSLSDIDAEAAITVEAGLTYSLDGGVFTGDAGTRGTAKKIRFRLTSSASYETLVTLDATIGMETYTMSVTTVAEEVAGDNSVFPYTFPFEVA